MKRTFFTSVILQILWSPVNSTNPLAVKNQNGHIVAIQAKMHRKNPPKILHIITTVIYIFLHIFRLSPLQYISLHIITLLPLKYTSPSISSWYHYISSFYHNSLHIFMLSPLSSCTTVCLSLSLFMLSPLQYISPSTSSSYQHCNILLPPHLHVITISFKLSPLQYTYYFG